MSKNKLNSYSADELLAELRQREQSLDKRGFAGVRSTSRVREMAEFSSADLAKALRAAQKVIYGIDNRMEAVEITDDQVRKSATGVASLIDVVDIEDNGDDSSTIRTVSFGDAQRLCSSESFRNQPTSPFCTGFLVGEQLLATAGHCIDGNNLARTRFVFGFQMNEDGTPNVVIPNDDIYSAVSIVAHRLESAGADYAVVMLDRPVTGRAILPIRRTGKIAKGRPVYVIGHPSGLPLKYAPGAAVRDNDAAEFFVANLDTYGGNSGSPVFDEATNVVEGILVRGETDFVLSGSCRVSNVCPTAGCRGEDVTRATEFAQFVPEIDEDSEEEPGEINERVEKLESAVQSIAAAVKRIEKKLP